MKQRLLLLLLLIPCLIAAAFAALGLVWSALFIPHRAHRLAVAFDQLANTATGGDEDETISSRAAKAALARKRWGCVLCRVLDWVDPGHCANNIELDEGEAVTTPMASIGPVECD